MSVQDPRLAWTVLLAPRGASLQAPPPWPAFVQQRFGEIPLGAVEPIQQVLQGPLPVQVLSRVDSGAARWLLSGLGRALGVTVLVEMPGESESDLPLEELRRCALATFLDKEGALEEDLVSGLGELVSAETDWDFLGLVEAVGWLSEGAASDLPDEDGWDDLDGLLLSRAAGVGPGHVAWQLCGSFSGSTQRSVMERRVQVLLEGHLKRASALLCFGLEALQWGGVVQSATRRAAALELVVDEVRLAASWAVSGGPSVELAPESYLALAARLETLRVGLEEDVQRLQTLRAPLVGAVERVLGEGKVAGSAGALIEASPVADELLMELAGRLKMAARWGDALRLSEKLVRQQA